MTAIVFDLDGTLVDSSTCIVESTHHVGREFNRPRVAEANIRGMIGQPLSQMLSTLFGLEAELLQQAVQSYSAEYVRRAAFEETLYDGAMELIQCLREAGFSLAIATGKSQSGAINASTRLGLLPWFDSVHGILPGTPGKPDPAVLIRAMEALGTEAERCIMVGDTTFDLDLAKAVGVRTAAVSWGMHSADQLQQRGPDFYAQSLPALQRWLLQQQ